MRIDHDKEFRIYCEDVQRFPFGMITEGVLEHAIRDLRLYTSKGSG